MVNPAAGFSGRRLRYSLVFALPMKFPERTHYNIARRPEGEVIGQQATYLMGGFYSWR